MKVQVSNYSSGWSLQVTTHPDFAAEVPTPSGWERLDNTRSGIRERWSTFFETVLPCSPLVLVPNDYGWVHSLTRNRKERLENFSDMDRFVRSEKGGVESWVGNDSFNPQVVLPPEVQEQLVSLCASINARQGEVERKEIMDLFGRYTAWEFQTTNDPAHICRMLARAGYRPWTKRYLGGRHLVAFAGPDGLVKAPKELLPHLIGKGGAMAREVCQVTGASRVIEG